MSTLRGTDKNGHYYQHATGERFYYTVKNKIERIAAKASASSNSESKSNTNVSVKTSTIKNAGQGLFANKAFNKGDIIIPYTGDNLTHAQYTQKYPNENAEYVLKLSKDHYIDAIHPSNIGSR